MGLRRLLVQLWRTDVLNAGLLNNPTLLNSPEGAGRLPLLAQPGPGPLDPIWGRESR